MNDQSKLKYFATDWQYSIEEIRQELSSLGITDVSEEDMVKMKNDLDALLRTERGKHLVKSCLKKNANGGSKSSSECQEVSECDYSHYCNEDNEDARKENVNNSQTDVKCRSKTVRKINQIPPQRCVHNATDTIDRYKDQWFDKSYKHKCKKSDTESMSQYDNNRLLVLPSHFENFKPGSRLRVHDPLTKFKGYTKDWARYPTPGENKHFELRRNVRARLLVTDIPLPLKMHRKLIRLSHMDSTSGSMNNLNKNQNMTVNTSGSNYSQQYIDAKQPENRNDVSSRHHQGKMQFYKASPKEAALKELLDMDSFNDTKSSDYYHGDYDEDFVEN